MSFAAFIHGGERSGFGISFSDFPGCVSDGGTVEEAIHRGSNALTFHVEGLLADGVSIPLPRSVQERNADPGLKHWRRGADIVFVPLILD